MSTFSGCRELSPSIVLCCSIAQNVFLMAHDSLLECMRNDPSDSDGDLPLVIWHFWRECPSCVRYHVMTLAYGRPVVGSVFPTEVILSIERMSVH